MLTTCLRGVAFAAGIVVLFAAVWISADEDPVRTELYPVLVDGKWGYIDETGELVIKPQFDYARELLGTVPF